MEQISDISKVVSVESAEGIELEYEVDGKKHVYLPDFKVVFEDGSVQIVETKGSFFLNDRRAIGKNEALKNYCEQNGFSWVVLTEKEIDKWLEQLKC